MTNDDLKKKMVEILKEAMEPIEYGGDREHAPEVHYPTEEEIADTLVAAGATIREIAKWLWDEEDDAPKCSCCLGRAMYQPHQKGNGEKLCFITLSLYCPQCGAKME